MQLLLLTAETAAKTSFFYENWIIIKQLIWLFGKFMSGIMYVPKAKTPVKTPIMLSKLLSNAEPRKNRL